MAGLSVMDAKDGFFEPMKGLNEEEASSAMCRLAALTVPDFFGTGNGKEAAGGDKDEESRDEGGKDIDEALIMEALKTYGVFDEYGPGAYQANEKLTNRLALVRLSRLYDAVFSNELRIIAVKYKMFECDIAADAMRTALKKAGKQGYVVSLYFSGAGGMFIECPENGKTSVSTTGFHVGVLYGDRIHCNVFPEGLPEKDWIESFFETSGKRPRIEYMPV
jgi:hypothetical protein